MGIGGAHIGQPRQPSSVYLGGGTPSYLSIPLLRELLDALDSATGFRNSAREVTVECNPESLDRDKAAALRELGANSRDAAIQTERDTPGPREALFSRFNRPRKFSFF